MAGQVEDFTPGGVFTGDNINFSVSQSSSSSSSTDKFINAFTWDAAASRISSTYNDNTEGPSIVITGVGEGGGGDPVTNVGLVGNDLRITLQSGEVFSTDFSQFENPELTDYTIQTFSLSGNTLTLTQTNGLGTEEIDLSPYDNIDNQVGSSVSFTDDDGNTYTVDANNKLTITGPSDPVPMFSPSENNPEPMNALDTTEVSFPAPEANEGFEIADVEVTMVDIKDTDGVTVSTDLSDVTVNNDNTIDVSLPTDEAIGDIELEVEVTDTDGGMVTLNPMAELFTPYFTLSTALGTTYSTVSDFQDDATESSEELGSSITVTGVGQGRKKYYAMINGTATFTQQGFMLAATIEATGKIGEYTYNLYNLGDFGNPFDATEDSPDITLNVTLT